LHHAVNQPEQKLLIVDKSMTISKVSEAKLEC